MTCVESVALARGGHGGGCRAGAGAERWRVGAVVPLQPGDESPFLGNVPPAKPTLAIEVRCPRTARGRGRAASHDTQIHRPTHKRGGGPAVKEELGAVLLCCCQSPGQDALT